jgi:hypothetical protein
MLSTINIASFINHRVATLFFKWRIQSSARLGILSFPSFPLFFWGVFSSTI